MENRQIKIGARYRHFKGNIYRVMGLAKDSETVEDVVIYKAHYGELETWVRPLKEFMGQVTSGEKTFNRFEEIPLGE